MITGGKFTTGAADTGGEPWLANISAILRKNLKWPNVVFRGLGEDDSWKNLKQKSRDTVSLRTHLWMMFCKFLSWASQKALSGKRTVLQYFLDLFNKTGENVAQGVYLERWRKKFLIYYSKYTHCRVCPFVGIGSTHPSPPASVSAPWTQKGGATHDCGWGGTLFGRGRKPGTLYIL